MNTYIKNENGYKEAIEQVYSIIDTSVEDKLKDNYARERLKTHEWVAVSIFEGGFSSIAYRSFWGNSCRILNRFYKNPNYRFENNKMIVSNETLQMIDQQIEAAKLLDFDIAFMSRETNTPAFKHYVKYLPQAWNISDKKYKMYEGGYQYIMWTSINNNDVLNMEIE